MMKTGNYVLVFFLIAAFVCCSRKRVADMPGDPEMEAMLAGVWINDEDGMAAFRAAGDTIYYPDRTVMPVHFRIYEDTIYLDGNGVTKYAIEKFTPHVLCFRNRNNETVKLVKSVEALSDDEFYAGRDDYSGEEINQQLQKRDTVVVAGERRYHCYVQVNPTTFKVLKNGVNDEGMDVGKIYYDNIVNLTVYTGTVCLYSHDLRKQDFQDFVPQEMMPHCILSDIVYKECSEEGVTFDALLRVPESASSYVAGISVSAGGEMSLMMRE